MKLFANGTSLFSVVCDKANTALELKILKLLVCGSGNGRCHSMSRQQKKLNFPLGNLGLCIPPLHLGIDVIARKTEHKHLVMILDENLDFRSHHPRLSLKQEGESV